LSVSVAFLEKKQEAKDIAPLKGKCGKFQIACARMKEIKGITGLLFAR
jgi:hypothetical protein